MWSSQSNWLVLLVLGAAALAFGIGMAISLEYPIAALLMSLGVGLLIGSGSLRRQHLP